MSKRLIAISAALLALAALLGIVNGFKARNVHAQVQENATARQNAERRLASEVKARKDAVAEAEKRTKKAEAKTAGDEADLVRTQTEKQDLLGKIHDNENEIAELKKRIEGTPATSAGPGSTPAPTNVDLQTQLEETKKQLDSAEKEKALLADKIRDAQDRAAQLEAEKKQRTALRGNPNVRGTILAVNQAYNFVVLNLGARQGVENNSEMLVLRDGTLIGKIRISSVEPATAIGDIISTSLARGVQVQPGDIVVYAGSNS